MATLVLSAAGAAIGGSIGGSVAGLSAVAIGRLAGATLGRAIDQRILGDGTQAVETGKIERFRLNQASEGRPVSQVYGRMRIGGQVIWATRFAESVAVSGGGKGAAPQPEVRDYSYTVSLAIALCEGEISHVARVWADGVEVAASDLNMRVYKGTQTQLPDPLIEVVEGEGLVPAYRGTAYVVMEDMPLAPFGNRVPQFSFEACRPTPKGQSAAEGDIAHAVKAVALMPGTGEYALATTPVFVSGAPGQSQNANVNSPSGQTDFVTSVDALDNELPNCGAVSLIVSWFGDDLRCGNCEIRPKVEHKEADGSNMPWQVCGETRATAQEIARIDDRPIYGGTPSDAAVIEAIRHLNETGKSVMFYPFLLMEQLAGNGLADPWSGNADQPVLPWRGRITTSKAADQTGTQDGTSAAEAEVAAFFGSATASDFMVGEGTVSYSGPQEWRYRRFILHCAALCAAAGGVESFCIGSEMRGLTRIRGAGNQFVAVQALRALVSEVRALLGPDVKLTYAADWSEYFGYHPQDGSGDVFFHLDPLWADPEIAFVGIDNYMPLSDWREDDDHADAEWGSVYNPDYLKANIEGGEGYDWFYHSSEARAAQIRTPITDGAHDEPWVFRYKDIANWWGQDHHERIGGVRQEDPTDWVPQSKPIVFTEMGCAAVDKGTNQPNKFLDPKSSESSLPRYSDGRRDDHIQAQYLRAMTSYWGDSENNPVSEIYGAQMVDMSRAHVWAWDARPFPFFPNSRDLWSDGASYARGHWINGRSATRPLASVVAEICLRSDMPHFDVSKLNGVVQGYVVGEVSDARSALQPLMMHHGFDAVERDGVIEFIMRAGQDVHVLDTDRFAVSEDIDGTIDRQRDAEAETTGRVRVQFVEADGDFAALAEEAVLPEDATHGITGAELPISMGRAEGRQIAERWLSEARVARERARFALPPSAMDIGAGDVVNLTGDGGPFRIERIEQGHYQIAEAVQIEASVYKPTGYEDQTASTQPFAAPVPVLPLFMDLPLLTGDETPHAPHLAVTATPWPGSVAVYGSDRDANYALTQLATKRATIGVTESSLWRAPAGLWDEGPVLQVKLLSGAFEGVDQAALLAGGNAAVIGDGTPGNWEVFQFREAELVAQDTWWLRGRLRGQLGTDAIVPEVWPQGSWVVLLNTAVEQLDLALSTRGRQRHYRIGPAQRGYDDPSYLHQTHAFAGAGLRPYSPCHLSATEQSSGDLAVTWVRRTRFDGDDWEVPEVPLNEEREAYVLRVLKEGGVVREEEVSQQGWDYTMADQSADGIVPPYEIQVAQVSGRFGPGPFASLTISA